MKNLLRLIVVALACQASVDQAFGRDEWLKVYRCDNEYQARSCQGCELDKELQLKFVVGRLSSGRTVFLYAKEGWWTTHPPVDLGRDAACDVIDNKNWSCVQEGIPGGSNHMVNYIRIKEMSNGIQFHYTSFFNPRANRLVEQFSCAK